MRIAVIDGQGGGIGYEIINQIRPIFSEDTVILALGTNAVAAAKMMKAKATQGASGENAIISTVPKVDLIIGALDILVADSFMGEISPKISVAIGQAEAKKILLPINRSEIEVVAALKKPLPHLFEDMLTMLKDYYT